MPDALTAAAVRELHIPSEGLVGSTFNAGILDALLSSMPSANQMKASRTAAVVGAGHALLLRQFMDAAGAHTDTWSIDKAQAVRLGLAHETHGDTTTVARPMAAEEVSSASRIVSRITLVPVRNSALLDLATAAAAPARQYDIQHTELTLEETAGARLAAIVRAAAAIRGAVVEKALLEMSDRLVRAVGPTDIARDRINIPALALVKKLESGGHRHGADQGTPRHVAGVASSGLVRQPAD